ncbi:hypothetical protein F5I97DRAFT_353472 [Phlebopus sp. FC_14]|nr:hypothetical protein F5I97DRAFT_353472 [Phlebopus sp. FC_14]
MTDAASGEPSTSSNSEWRSIRPWTPHLTLAVREITSVSATFILSSSLEGHSPTDVPERDLPMNDVQDGAVSDSLADAMSHGLSVDVNGSNWQRVILRMNDRAEEAIIVIYGLHPGRQYDIDLSLVSGGTMRKQVITEESSVPVNERNEEHSGNANPDSIALPPSTTTTGDPSQSTPTPSPAPSPEDRLRMLSHTLNSLHSEQATLQSALKTSRRDANKTSTALRAEIDVLKRASEKAGIAEGKARQRVRALEDAVRRANEGRAEIEQATEADLQELPALQGKESETEKRLKKVKAAAEEVREERERREEEDRKRKENMKAECVALGQRLDRLGIKKDRLEGSVIPDLESQLAEIEREIGAAEQRVLQGDETSDGAFEDSSGSKGDSQRRRQSHPGAIGRLTSAAVQRPGQGHAQAVPPSYPRHQPRSQSAYWIGSDLGSPGLSHPPGLAHPAGLAHAPGPSPSYSGTSPFPHSTSSCVSQSGSPVLSHTTSFSLSRSTSSAASSTLSSKAAPFEPTGNLRVPYSQSSSTPSVFTSGNSHSPGQGGTAFSPNGSGSSAFPSPVSSTFALSGTIAPVQRSHVSHSSALGGSRLGKVPISKGSGVEDTWTVSNG